ncbi:MAG: hypothetical protein IPN93_03170 [Bacteroidetes bacterium]|nr:hypothetical protein [Bacteroidota bacterium]
MNKYATSGIMGHDAIYVHLAEKYYLPRKATWSDSATLAKIQESVFYLKPTLIGSYAPRITGLNKDSTKAVVIDSIIFKHDFTIIAFGILNAVIAKQKCLFLPAFGEIHYNMIKLVW